MFSHLNIEKMLFTLLVQFLLLITYIGKYSTFISLALDLVKIL